MRPEAERRLREGFQRRVDEQASRYAAQLAQARQQAARFECGEVAGVFPTVDVIIAPSRGPGRNT